MRFRGIRSAEQNFRRIRVCLEENQKKNCEETSDCISRALLFFIVLLRVEHRDQHTKGVHLL